MIKKFLIISICVFFALCSIVSASAAVLGDIYVWNDDYSYTINIWENARDNNASLSVYTLAESGFTTFENYKNNARNQWNMFDYTTGTSLSHNIAFIGGSYNYLKAINPSIPSNVSGWTSRYYTSTGTDRYRYMLNQYSYRPILVNYLEEVFCYVVDSFTGGPDFIRNAMVHEFGHGVGWVQHSASDYDVMYPNNSDVFNLTARDHDHLSQFYN